MCIQDVHSRYQNYVRQFRETVLKLYLTKNPSKRKKYLYELTCVNKRRVDLQGAFTRIEIHLLFSPIKMGWLHGNKWYVHT